MLGSKYFFSGKIAVAVIIITAVIFIGLFFLIGFYARKVSYLESERLAMEASKKASVETQNYLASAFHVTRTFANSAKVLKKNHVSRKILVDMMLESIHYDSSFLAVWIMWEPNMYDGKDKQFANVFPYDSNGTLAVTYYWHDNQILSEINESSDFQEDFYTIPRKKRKEIITEPYLWNYTGIPDLFFETSVITPIIIDTTFLGVFAVDIDFRKLQQMHNHIRIYNSGFVSLISGEGIIISNPDSSLINRPIQPLFNSASKLNWEKRQLTQAVNYRTISEFTGKKVFRIINPIIIGNTDEAWYMLIEIPENEINANSIQLLVTSFIILIIGILLMMYMIINLKIRRKYEQQLLVEKLKAQESDRLKSAFLANMSHEIRTPMNGIIGFSELLSEPGLPFEKQKKLSKNIIECSYNLLNIVTDILEIALIETGEIKIFNTPVDLSELFDRLYEQYKLKAKEKNLNLYLENKIVPNSAKIVTDWEKLLRVIKCILNNALKFTLKGYIKISVTPIDNIIVISVEDSGIGIAPELHDKIFENFRQAEMELSRQYGGTGLGLSISKKIIHLLGGKIWLKSEPYKGSIFYISLPAIYENPINS
jgi:signal transduction histidine kinase